MTLGKIIRGWREREHIGLRDAAKLIGIPISTLSRLETGKPVESTTLVKIFDWLFH